jgi:hypothetical protein
MAACHCSIGKPPSLFTVSGSAGQANDPHNQTEDGTHGKERCGEPAQQAQNLRQATGLSKEESEEGGDQEHGGSAHALQQPHPPPVIRSVKMHREWDSSFGKTNPPGNSAPWGGCLLNPGFPERPLAPARIQSPASAGRLKIARQFTGGKPTHHVPSPRRGRLRSDPFKLGEKTQSTRRLACRRTCQGIRPSPAGTRAGCESFPAVETAGYSHLSPAGTYQSKNPLDSQVSRVYIHNTLRCA